ncbi:hypothetical protein KUTG_10050 [Kutzneria sp. 744]|nr:hypothetical protein KUTG_10050 [Kutzneria sp. 744]
MADVALTLPTDTPHIAFESRQYELFGQPISQGIRRRRMGIGAVVVIVWAGLMLLILVGICGLPLINQYIGLIYVAPPAGALVLAFRVDETGRMAANTFYDWLLSRLPGRRRIIRNPLSAHPHRQRQVVRMIVVAEIRHAPPGQDRAGRRKTKSRGERA